MQRIIPLKILLIVGLVCFVLPVHAQSQTLSKRDQERSEAMSMQMQISGAQSYTVGRHPDGKEWTESTFINRFTPTQLVGIAWQTGFPGNASRSSALHLSWGVGSALGGRLRVRYDRGHLRAWGLVPQLHTFVAMDIQTIDRSQVPSNMQLGLRFQLGAAVGAHIFNVIGSASPRWDFGRDGSIGWRTTLGIGWTPIVVMVPIPLVVEAVHDIGGDVGASTWSLRFGFITTIGT